jgi:hypothetical protein
MTNIVPYNPLDRRNLGGSVADALERSSVYPLGSIGRFEGAGVYVIYYRGGFPAYHALAERNSDDAVVPIYVGKAIPKGGRRGGDFDSPPGKALYTRLAEHAESIRAVSNLLIEDFVCRYLVVDDIWVPLGENLMISRYTPLWNKLIDGFGNHDPGRGRHSGMCSRWDVLHPGRTWVAKLAPRGETPEQLASEAEQFLANYLR